MNDMQMLHSSLLRLEVSSFRMWFRANGIRPWSYRFIDYNVPIVYVFPVPV